ncbi:flagellin N-terminal helical domain-containing protein [Roseibium alexandrii]|uniref:Flagellin n=1 Tax=Roseibium alexandrii TaxID=388408 RepID=A0A0M7AK55_9HYPH|nr:flagellin [Roseibium alexandrii]CTQ75027.1 Flagellin [Roseibium alexandrii]
MSSLLTNSSAMTALQTLSMTNKNMATTQNRISTGLRVNDAADNAAYWSIATTMRSDVGALSAVQDSLGLGAATLDVTFTAINSTVDTLNEIKEKLVAAKGQTDSGREKIQEDISNLQKQLETYANSAVTSSGDNWLVRDPATQDMQPDVVGSFTRNSDGSTRIEQITVDLANVFLIDSAADTGLLDSDMVADIQTAADAAATADGGTPPVDLSRLTGGTASILTIDISNLDESANDKYVVDGLVSVVDQKIAALTDAATTIGSSKKRVDSQMDFVKALSDSYTRGIGQLVDADMNAESTRLQALQTQQQLGIQALSIANQGAQNILSLFR